MKKNSLLLCCFAATFVFVGCTKKENAKPALDTANMDTTVKPGVDFFEYANGTWMKNTKMPEDKSRYGSFDILAEENDLLVKKIFDEAATKTDAPKGSNWQKVGDFFTSGMDTTQIDKQGFDPIKPELNLIASITNTDQLLKAISELQKEYIAPLFIPVAGQDNKKADTIIVNLYSDGLGLPDRDYYFNKDERTVEIRKQYVDHIKNMFALIGITPDEAQKAADQIMTLETELANVTFTRVESRDPYKTYNKVSIEQMQQLAPSFKWNEYFTNLGIEVPKDFVIDNPNFYKEANKMIDYLSIDAWKNYLTWNVLNRYASFLSQNFDNEHFDFYGRKLSGIEVQRPRWQRVSSTANFTIGELVGQIFVEENFPPEAKQKMVDLIGNLKLSFKDRIENLTWMSDSTKAKAIDKLQSMVVKVGYPDKWKDYSSLDIERGSYANNIRNAAKFRFKENMDKLGKPVDRTEWEMTPQTVNAYYNPLMNEIVFPAGILQPPFFNKDADDAVNYGAIGVVIGHEMTHGFDDQGRNYDKNGNLSDWWTKDDATKFNELTQALVNQFDRFVAIDSMHVNGKLTLGENIADYGGLTISYHAFQKSLAGKATPQPIDGFTANQRFFLSYANVWRQIIRDKELMRRVKEDVHSPGRFRVNGALFNIPEFYEAFNISPNDPLYIAPENRAKIW
ncbi:MAG: M13 family metallopeptidase [Bacteroidales bacterium]|nr:M13 family metallopeptidase [Bacteroidales bacterium]HPD96247.1 M13 family metallopeptidase [Tenuifilaceae bacterium]